MNYIKIMGVALIALVLGLGSTFRMEKPRRAAEITPFENITLEMSLKPFKSKERSDIEAVISKMFSQWYPLLKHADTVSVMIWAADGSEILDYSGRLGQGFEWAKYIGNPNTEYPVGTGPKDLTIHQRAYLYTDKPVEFTYKDLKLIIASLKKIGSRLTGKPIRVGATFDPGPEFAKSPFKYKLHPEILEGNAMGFKTFVSSYSQLKGDSKAYAGFAKGIPDQTPFSTFFGRQCQHFLTDLGYDYLWFSNGFGFGIEPWASTGSIFSGTSFKGEKLEEVSSKIQTFWKLFRLECPGFRIETRGTNLSTGIDLAKDGVNLRSLYKGRLNILPPPNSPWAALDGDFGLELAGYMSRISELPDYRYLFRYYTHDPWWLNSPWLDRYGREPHDIFLPLSVARLDSLGSIKLPTHMNFLTVDNSFGEMPDQVPNEVIPYVLSARSNSPSAPGPLVWVYPFSEYHQWADQQKERLAEMYYGDWFIRQSINNGFPLNTVISTDNFNTAIAKNPKLFDESILVSIVPDPGTVYERKLMAFVKSGGKVICYGPADYASEDFKKLVNLKNTQPLSGVFQLDRKFSADRVPGIPLKILHDQLFSGGGIATNVADPKDLETKILLKFEQQGEGRDVVWSRTMREWQGGKIAYVRGTNSSEFTGGRLLVPHNPLEYFTGPMVMRTVLAEFGIAYELTKSSPVVKNPVLSISRHDNAFFFSGYNPNTTVKHTFKWPQGAPIFMGLDTELMDGSSQYTLPTAWNKEVRLFVSQQQGMITCKETYSGEMGITRRIRLYGLKDATVRIYPEMKITEDRLHVYLNVLKPLNAEYAWKDGRIPFKKGPAELGYHYQVEKVTGDMVISW